MNKDTRAQGEAYPFNLLSEILKGMNSTAVYWRRPLTVEQRNGLTEALTYLTPRENAILNMYFSEEKSLADCACEFDCSIEWARQKIIRAIRKLRKPELFNLIQYGKDVCETIEEIDRKKKDLMREELEIDAMNRLLLCHKDYLGLTIEQYRPLPEKSPVDPGLFPIDSLNLSARAYNVLSRNGASTVADVLALIASQSLETLRNCGRKTADEIYDRIDMFLKGR